MKAFRNIWGNGNAVEADEADDPDLESAIEDAMTDIALARSVVDVQPEPTLLEYNISFVERALASLRDERALLEHIIAEKQERLRQANVSIEGYELAHERMTHV